MGKFTISHEINCDAETFWKVFFDKTFNEELFKNQLGFPRYDIVEQRETDQEVFRKVVGQPKMELPGPVAKLIGPGFSYIEEGRLNRSTKVWSWKMTPSTMADKLRQEGTMRIEPVGDKKVRRVTEMTIEAKVFGVGGLIESTVEKQLREGWDHSAQFMNRWIADGKAG
ncbi:DUF2505 domain-containing protein [Chondromyces apiculatus]|uniref:DUF2505 domain-containing protein n=1 Tax=Chondromyces apiculatus DSM 436 TaxID=1192034 RepID=A0A017TEC3_9BACT|nr:DUF2505 domain-containing protein [Chondromyces apiculatus]EYF07564.1 Hypothetical protein CAP_8687 [Chondromyces apiculatus DSM 436]